ncbi:MAG: SMC-Scp complex subunit ScpB [Planctomycetaceae bacterium]|nr:SMC-Scp complex subunit ScpB [Planctomycetaceae bacterium]MCB9951560.1 SMC-Scp complex subunit ScpB [Planctomycetaceae bacterium]
MRRPPHPLQLRSTWPPSAKANGWCWNFLRRNSAHVELVEPETSQRSAKLARVEAALFVANGVLTKRKLVQVATLIDVHEAADLIEELNANYERSQSAFRVEQVATGYQLLTRPQYARWLDRIHHRQERQKLSNAALETLVIIAYRQPITRADIEAVRGVQASEIIKQLMERNLVRVTGEDDSLGRPFLYGTTKTFLEEFGLQSLDDLPMAASLRMNHDEEFEEEPDSEVDDDLEETDAEMSDDAATTA